MPACRDIPYVLEKLSWMRAERIWPNGQRYTWTDAFGVVLLVSLYEELGKPRFIRGLRKGELPQAVLVITV